MHLRLACVALLGAAAHATEAWAQKTGDQARLIFTVSAGAVGGQKLWSIGAQPVQYTIPSDTFALERRIRSTIGVGFGGSYFAGEHLGLGIDGFLVGLGFEDSCRQVFSSGSANVAAACSWIQGNKKPASTVMLSAGPILRFNSRKPFSPYARFNVGFLFSTQSSLRTIGRYPSDSGLVDLIVYNDDRDSRTEPAFALGAGFTVPLSPGYQLRLEARDNILGVQRVTRSTPTSNVIPPHKLDYRHLFSLTIGFDVVLERKRGRRY
jgi:opacity protein-like surface antigen